MHECTPWAIRLCSSPTISVTARITRPRNRSPASDGMTAHIYQPNLSFGRRILLQVYNPNPHNSHGRGTRNIPPSHIVQHSSDNACSTARTRDTCTPMNTHSPSAHEFVRHLQVLSLCHSPKVILHTARASPLETRIWIVFRCPSLFLAMCRMRQHMTVIDAAERNRDTT